MPSRRGLATLAAAVAALLLVHAGVASADDASGTAAPGRAAIIPDEHGKVAVLPATPSPHCDATFTTSATLPA